MKLIKITAILCLSLYTCVRAQAQNVSSSKLNWSSASTMKPVTAENIDEITQLVVDTDQTIQWKTSDGTLKYNLTITKINGSWNDATQPGMIIYEVDNNGKRGVITIERTDKDRDTVKVRMMLTTNSEPNVYELTVTSFQTF